MPKTSKDIAPAHDVGPVLDHSEDLDGYTVNFVTIKQTHSLASLLKGLPDDACQCPHWGYVLNGTVDVSYTDRPDETYRAGDAFYMPPGHVPAAEEGSEFVQFSPKNELAVSMAAMMANAQRAAGR
jgi:hypothetical protein